MIEGVADLLTEGLAWLRAASHLGRINTEEADAELADGGQGIAAKEEQALLVDDGPLNLHL